MFALIKFLIIPISAVGVIAYFSLYYIAGVDLVEYVEELLEEEFTPLALKNVNVPVIFRGKLYGQLYLHILIQPHNEIAQNKIQKIAPRIHDSIVRDLHYYVNIRPPDRPFSIEKLQVRLQYATDLLLGPNMPFTLYVEKILEKKLTE